MTRAAPILTTDLALRLERYVAAAFQGGAQVTQFGRVVAHRPLDRWPPPAVFCFNGDDVGRLGDVLAFFGGGAPPTFHLSPAAFAPAVGGALQNAGYGMAAWSQSVLYGLPADAPPPPPGVTIERVTSATADLAADVATEANRWAEPWAAHAKQALRESVDRTGFHLYLARHRDVPAGVGGVTLGGGDEAGWARLGGGAVLPRYRGRGLHTALLWHRLGVARGLGQRLVVGGADLGSASFRNQQRVGFRLAYVEAEWRRAP